MVLYIITCNVMYVIASSGLANVVWFPMFFKYLLLCLSIVFMEMLFNLINQNFSY